jgi:hypothetical protein
MGYTPTTPPADIQFLADYVQTELVKIAEELGAVKDIRLDERHAAPSKPRDGDIVLADGTDWNPGSGAGFYGYHNGTYTFLG